MIMARSNFFMSQKIHESSYESGSGFWAKVRIRFRVRMGRGEGVGFRVRVGVPSIFFQVKYFDSLSHLNINLCIYM